MNNNGDRKGFSAPSTSSKAGESTTPRPLSLLLAEDTPANQKVIGSILRERGYDVAIAANGREALSYMAHGTFDAVLMDLQMPVMDGYQATAAIRESERGAAKRIPIIALTAHSADLDRDACLRAGMDAHISKPIDVVELTRMVESITQVDLPNSTSQKAGPATDHQDAAHPESINVAAASHEQLRR